MSEKFVTNNSELHPEGIPQNMSLRDGQTSSDKVWDEILKAIVDAMPEQLFPLFKEVYGKEYPKGTTVILLATESSTFQENPNVSPGSRLSDIALLVNGTDYYHLECQMRNEREMVIRMVAYDLHFAMQHTTFEDYDTGEIIMHFPHSTVIYPEKNKQIPEFLRCRIIFQDKSEHIYQIPTVRIQSYSLQEIHEKHLNLFIPYVLLRLRPKLSPKIKHPLTKKELTAFVYEVILILEDELHNGYLTGREFEDYINLFRSAANKIFEKEKHSEFREEVERMTKPMIELSAARDKRLKEEMMAAMGDELRAEVIKRLRAEVIEDLNEQLRAEVIANLNENLRAEVIANLNENLRAEVIANLNENLRAEVMANLNENLKAEVMADLNEKLSGEVEARLKEELSEKIKAQLKKELEDRIRAEVNAELAKKDMELARLKGILKKYNITAVS